jgi:hypothetical protein
MEATFHASFSGETADKDYPDFVNHSPIFDTHGNESRAVLLGT